MQTLIEVLRPDVLDVALLVWVVLTWGFYTLGRMDNDKRNH
jgi:hypothetical protein